MTAAVGFIVAAVLIIDAVLMAIAARRRHTAHIDDDDW